MRPYRSFLLLLIVLACLVSLSYVLPGSKFFPPLSFFFPSFTSHHELFQGDNKAQGEIPHPDQDLIYPVDSVLFKDSADFYSAGITTNPLASFLDSLRNPETQIRILYYGDSQIEGDRITSYLRELLRKGRGGSGPGLFLPLMPVMYTKSLWLHSSANWKRYNYLSYKSGDIKHNRLGPFMTICRYLPEGKFPVITEKAFIRIRPSLYADEAATDYDILRIFYANAQGKIIATVKGDDNLLFTDSLRSGRNLQEITCNLYKAKDILIEFEGRSSPDIYGISIESNSGIVVDNIPRRGSAGLEFTLLDKDNLKEGFHKLSPDLIILHYGLNIVNNVRSDYSYYRRGVSRQLTLLREVAPYDSGAGDRSYRYGKL